MTLKKIILELLFVSFAFTSFGQLTAYERRILKEADSYYDNKQYNEALPLFIRLDSLIDDYQIIYRIGVCYINTEYGKLKALPYLEEIAALSNVDVPSSMFFHLGMLYHYTYRFDEATEQFDKFIRLSSKGREPLSVMQEEAYRMKEICKNAIEVTKKQYKAEVDVVGNPINTMESESCPMITADENTMVFMRTIGQGKVPNPETIIMISHKTNEGYWSDPIELFMEKNKDYEGLSVKLAGLSPDGSVLFLNIGNGLNTDIYSARIVNNTIVDVLKLNKKINSPYYEGRVSVSSDGTELYFVSDRPGGFGGSDIYKSKLNRRGEWDKPKNMGNVINTKYNENSPFMHPDNSTFFFSSDGHKTMGGNDIFKTKFKNEKWTEPQNQGYLNSTKDDLYFVMNANGQVGYFSTSKNNIYEKHNIFKVAFSDPIPLTVVKGTIKAGTPPKPISAKIKVYDKETGEQIKYVYNPDPIKGKYLMIFPPAKNYDIVVSSDDFLPQIINVNIPYQTYFYELYQEITLQSVKLGDRVVGEKVTVNNTFYDLYKTAEADSILLDDLPKQPKYYDHLLELVEDIIQTTDRTKISYIDKNELSDIQKNDNESLLNIIESAIETTDIVTLSILDANTKQKEKVNTTHFYTGGDKEKSLTVQVIGKDTLFTATPILTDVNSDVLDVKTQRKIKKIRNENKFRVSGEEGRNYLDRYTIYYDVNKYEIPQQDFYQLNEISRILINNPLLGVEIFGFADSQGEEKYNLSLSKQRAQKILEYLIKENVPQFKLIAKGFGELETSGTNKVFDKSRKVEISVFELIEKEVED